MPTKKVDLSIIIVNYNTKDLLHQCLTSLVNNSPLLGVEVIVVDNGSEDGSRDLIQNLKLKIQNENLKFKIILNKENLGFAKANNLGLKKAQGDFLLFLNSDTKLMPGALAEAVDFMKKDRKIGALSAKTLLPSGKIDPDCHRGFPTPWASISYFLGLEKLFPKSRLFGQYHQFYLDLDKNHEIDAGAGAFMMIRREILEKVGAWDEEYFFYGEDLDFFYRIKQAGYKIMFYAKPLVVHYKGASSGLRKESKGISDRQNRLKVAKASVEAMEIFYRKFYQEKYPRWLTWLVLLGIRIKGFWRFTYHFLKLK